MLSQTLSSRYTRSGPWMLDMNLIFSTMFADFCKHKSFYHFSLCHAWTVTIGQKRSTWRTWGNTNGTRSESETKNQNGFMICILSLKMLICSRTCAISLQKMMISNHPIEFVRFRFQVSSVVEFSKYCLAELNDVVILHWLYHWSVITGRYGSLPY